MHDPNPIAPVTRSGTHSEALKRLVTTMAPPPPLEDPSSSSSSTTTTSPTHSSSTNHSNSSWSSFLTNPSAWSDRIYEFSNQQRLDRLQECLELERLLARRRDATTSWEELQQQQQQQPSAAAEVASSSNVGEGLRRKMLRFYQWQDTTVVVEEKEKDETSKRTDIESPPPPQPSINRLFSLLPKGIATALSRPTPSTLNDTTAATPTTTATTTTASSSPTNTTNNIVITDDPAKHVHLIWGCRAMALACAHHLLQVRSCVHTHYHHRRYGKISGGVTTRVEDMPVSSRLLPMPEYDQSSDGNSSNSSKSDNNNNNNQDQDTFQDPCQPIQQTLANCVTKNIVRLEQSVAKQKKRQSTITSSSQH